MNTIASTSSSKFLYGFLVNVFSTSLLVRVLLSHMLNARFAWPDVFFWMGVAASLIIFTRKCLHGSPLSVARRLLPLLTLLAIASVLLPFFTPRPGWHGLVNAVVLLGVTAPQLLLIIRAEQRLIALHRAFLETEARLAESEQRWHQLVAHSPFPIVVHQDGHIVLINKAGQQELGLHDWQEMIGKPFADMLDPFSAANMAALLSKADAASAPLQLEHRYVRSDGTAAPFLSLSLPLLLEGKRAFLTMGKEMPPAKPMEQAPNYRRFTEFLPEAHVVHEGGDITYINRAGLELFGIKSPHDVLGAPFSSLFHPGDRPSNSISLIRNREKSTAFRI
jgi:PAS domain S-box-containing protein